MAHKSEEKRKGKGGRKEVVAAFKPFLPHLTLL